MSILGFNLGWILWVLIALAGIAVLWGVYKMLGIRIIRSDMVGIVEKWWSPKGSLKEQIIALGSEAGYQPEILRGGIHIRPGLMYKVAAYSLVTIPEGQIGYIYARGGQPLEVDQTLGKTMPLEAILDVRKFLAEGGQQGPQRTVLRPGVFAINLAQFVVITKNKVYHHPVGDQEDRQAIESMRNTIATRKGFEPLIITGDQDMCGIVTVHDGPSLASDDTGRNIICPIVGTDFGQPDTYHNNFQDPEKFLAAGGFRGRQLQVITEGTYWINRLFADVEPIKKTIIDVGYCGVVVSYVGQQGNDVSGEEFLHGELVQQGERGVWKDPLLPGKYAINTYAYKVVPVPTTNVILKWKTEAEGEHKLDSNLCEVGIITKDAFEPTLPLSVVVHIDYKRAPHVIQRFGEVKKLVEQTLDPMVSAYFKNVGQTKTLIELLQQRGAIQQQATAEMKARFGHYNLELEEVLMDTPRSPAKNQDDDRIEQILTQLRDRQVATEKLETFEKQRIAADKERELKEAQSVAEQQTALTQSAIKIQVQENEGAAEAKRAEQQAEKVKTLAAAEAEKVKMTAQAEAERIKLTGQAEAARVSAMAEAQAKQAKEVGLAEAEAIEARIGAFKGDGAELQVKQALGLAAADAVKNSTNRLVPDQIVTFGGGDGGAPSSVEALLGVILSGQFGISVAPKSTEPAEPGKVVEMPTVAEEPADVTPPATDTPSTELPLAAGAEDEVIPTAPANEESTPSGRKPRKKGQQQ